MLEKCRNIFNLAIPLLITAFGNMMFQIADEAIIGRTSMEELAGVSAIANVIYLVIGSFGVLAIAFSIMFLRARKDEDIELQESLLSIALYFGFFIGIFFVIIVLVGADYFLLRIYSLSEKTYFYAKKYLIISSITLLFNLLCFILASYFKAVKRTKIIMYANVSGLIVNFILDYILVFGKFGIVQLGVVGAAIGTVVGIVIEFVIMCIYFYNINTLKLRLKFDKLILLKLIKFYIPLLLQDFVEYTLFIIVLTSIITRIGVESIASYGLLEIIGTVLVLPSYSLTNASLSLYLQDKKLTYKDKLTYPIISGIIPFILSLSLSILILFFPRDVIGLFTNQKLIIEFSYKYIILVVISSLFNIFVQVYKMYLQSIGKEKWVLAYTVVIYFCFSIIIYLVSVIFSYNLIGLYYSMILMYIILFIGYFIKYIKCCVSHI